MNETIQVLKNRRSIRTFNDKPVPKELVEQIVDAGIWAASGAGRQVPIVVAITNPELRDRLSAMNAKIMGKEGFDPFYGGKTVLVVLAERSFPTQRPLALAPSGSTVPRRSLTPMRGRQFSPNWALRATLRELAIACLATPTPPLPRAPRARKAASSGLSKQTEGMGLLAIQ